MIGSFGDKTTGDTYHGRPTKAARKISPDLWERVQSKLDLMNAALTLEDLRVPPSNHLEKLRGSWNGYYSIRVNQQYRLVFRFADGACNDVRCVDDH